MQKAHGDEEQASCIGQSACDLMRGQRENAPPHVPGSYGFLVCVLLTCFNCCSTDDTEGLASGSREVVDVLVRLDHHSAEPIWRQIVEQVKYMVASGRLALGDRLPSIRALASELRINPRTVVRAYEELHHLGLVVMRQGRGVFVKDVDPEMTFAARRRILTDMTRRLLAEASRLGTDVDTVIDVVRRVAVEMKGDDGRTSHTG